MSAPLEYKLIGEDLQAVIISLKPGETVIAEAGAMMFMEDGIVLETTLDPNHQGGGLLGKLMGGARRMMAGDSFFMTAFTNNAGKKQNVAFAEPYPGKIIALDLREWRGRIIAQKSSFLCAARGTNISLAFTKKIGAGFFGGEGFILQQLDGDGLAFLHACGTIHEITLGAGEGLRVDTGCLVALEDSVDYDIETVPGITTAFFGGEGLFYVRLRGPGRVLLQTLPFSRLADRIIAAAPSAGGQRREEGSVLGALGGFIDGNQ